MAHDPEPLSLPPEAEKPQSAAVPTRRERVKAQAGRIVAGLETIRPESRTVRTGFLIYERDRTFPTSLLVSAVSVRLVIFLIPFLILTIFTIGLGADVANTDPTDLAADVSLPALFADAASDTTTVSAGLRGFALIATIFAMLWAANGLGKTMQLAFAVVWQVPERPSRPWYMPLIVIVVVLFSMSANAIGSQFQQPGPVDEIIRLAAELIFVSAIWLAVSRALPHAPGASRWRDFLPGTLLVAIGVLALRVAMLVYIAPKWASLNARYGTIGIVLVMLSWAYIVAAAAVYSAHINAALFETAAGRSASSRRRVLPQFIREQWRDLRKASGEPR